MNKNNNKQEKNITAFEYKMPKEIAANYLKGKKVPNVNEYLCKIVNEEFGLLHPCVNVIVG